MPVLVVAAHPDDETIGAAALLLRSPGCAVVHVTDGAPVARTFWAPGIVGPREEYASLRRAELRAAMRVAGVAEDRLYGLGAADQEAALDLVALSLALAARIAELRPKRVVTHPYEGGHPDHDAAAFVTRAALELHRRAGLRVPPLFEMTSYHAQPDGRLETLEFLDRGAGPVHTRVLGEVERRSKEQMLAAYESQREVIAWFPRDRERLRRAPVYDFTRAPHEGRLWYERMGFPLTGERWRALAADALSRLAAVAWRRAPTGEGRPG